MEELIEVLTGRKLILKQALKTMALEFTTRV
jgi:hypothetical protein